MQDEGYPKLSLRIILVAGALFLCSVAAQGQEVRDAASSSSSGSETPAEVRALSDLIRGLQAQVQTLNSQLGDLRMEQERASAEARDQVGVWSFNAGSGAVASMVARRR